MRISDLPVIELQSQVQRSGIYLKTGVFVTHIQSSIASVAQNLALLYADYPLVENRQFADFHVRVTKPANLRRWIRPQVLFFSDDTSAFKPLPLTQAFPMLEWGMNWCISGHAHSYLMIHAAVVEKNNRAAILPAPPGSGKSTLCAALINRGWRLLSDEITLIRLQDGLITPIPRPVSLKNQSINIIRHFAHNGILSPEVRDTIKGTVAHLKPPTDSVVRATEHAQPAWIIFPKYQAKTEIRLEALSRAHAFMQVADNSFNYSLLGHKGFDALGNLVDRSSCFKLTYSVLDEAIDCFDSLSLENC